MNTDLNSLRSDAVTTLLETFSLYVAWANGKAKQEQVTLAGKFFVSALAKYTLACNGG